MKLANSGKPTFPVGHTLSRLEHTLYMRDIVGKSRYADTMYKKKVSAVLFQI